MSSMCLRKTILSILVIALLLVMVLSSSVIANTEENSYISGHFKLLTPVAIDNSLNYTEISKTIYNYFKYYYLSLEKKEMVEEINEYILETEETYLYLKSLQYGINWRKELNLGIKDSNVSLIDIKYADEISEGKVDIRAYIKVDYRYAEDKTNTMTNVGDLWDIVLKNDNGSFKIISLNSESNDYKHAKELVKNKKEKMAKSVDSYSTITAIDDAFADINSQIGDLKKLFFNSSATQNENLDEELVAPSAIQSVSVTYNKSRARQYANLKGYDEDTLIFKRMDADCTNFVSQCLWAGYGGDKENSWYTEPGLSACRQLAYDNFRQIGGSGKWWGVSQISSGTYASGPWMRVIELYSYITTSSAGPRGNKYNNGQLYTASSLVLQEGDILQLSTSSSSSDYFHSVMVVTGGYTMSSGSENIYIGQHSSENGYRQLAELIASNSAPYVRVIRPITGSFDK